MDWITIVDILVILMNLLYLLIGLWSLQVKKRKVPAYVFLLNFSFLLTGVGMLSTNL